MPFCYHTLDRLGLVEEMDKVGFTQKLSVQFVTQDGQAIPTILLLPAL